MAATVWLTSRHAPRIHLSQVPPHVPLAAQAVGGPPALSGKRVEEKVMAAYNSGSYAEAERAAQTVLSENARSTADADKPRAARARWVLAFSAARRKDLPLARERFAQLQHDAAQLPDHGAQEASVPGQPEPTLEEEGAYQHAVLTAALARQSAVGGRQSAVELASSEADPSPLTTPPLTLKDAEAEFVEFMRRYPDSPLLRAAVQRIGRMHGGNIPKDAEAVWKQAHDTALARAREKQRAQSLCAPECLAEVLRREQAHGGSVAGLPGGSEPRTESATQPPNHLATAQALAKEMGTSYRGTTLKELAGVAKKHGFEAKGLQLTWEGLLKQFSGPASARPRYVVALVQPGHYALVELASSALVRYWDPDRDGPGKGGRRDVTIAEWKKLWGGVVLALR